ncbi:FecR domain-containing protein [Luteolibacter marinus]|uniref:FecR domain-containing protein n=1 Tax=Luteolibacter marinus TaxID=2776705 RepID=UPI0018678B00|nr:FecR domain-containing protein [Luteolibacter marinus]
MTPRKPSPRQLEQLFQDLEDGAISAEDHAWLMDLLRHDPEVREAYCLDHMVLAHGLHELAEFWGSEREQPGVEPVEERRRRSWRTSFFAAAALVALLAVAGSLITIHSRRLPPSTVTAGVQSAWRFESGGLGEDGSFLPSTRVQVEHGTVEIMTRHRSRMVVEGPAIIEIHNPVLVSLLRGKGWFDVAEDDIGFTVLTERARVVDLGTRFGVASSRASDRVQVDSGKVRVESRFPGVPSRELGVGEAAETDPVGRSKPVPFDGGVFLRELPRKLVAIHWSFDETTDGAFPSSAEGLDPEPVEVLGLDGKVVKPRLEKGRFGEALDLTEPGRYGKSRFPGISGSGARTIAFWFRGSPIVRRQNVRRESYTPPIVLWGDPSVEGGYWSLRAHCVGGIIGTQWGWDGYKTGGVIGSRDIHDGGWHHLASVFTGMHDKDGSPEVIHYIDGEPMKTTGAILATGINTLSGDDGAGGLRLAFDPYRNTGAATVPVSLDELYVVRAALDAEQIGVLFRENRLETRD